MKDKKRVQVDIVEMAMGYDEMGKINLEISKEYETTESIDFLKEEVRMNG
jgi:hypothetical protein